VFDVSYSEAVLGDEEPLSNGDRTRILGGGKRTSNPKKKGGKKHVIPKVLGTWGGKERRTCCCRRDGQELKAIAWNV